MRKYLLIVLTLVAFQQSFSQVDGGKRIRKEIDSMENILPILTGTKKVDCLNTIAHKFFYAGLPTINQQMDSSYKYVMQAFNEAKRIGYQKGLGYAYSRLISIDNGRFNASVYSHKPDSSFLKDAKKNIAQTIKFGEELNDNTLLAIANWKLAWLATVFNDSLQYIEYLKKTAYYFERSQKVPEGGYKEQEYADCPGCDGNEYWLTEVYNELSTAYINMLEDINNTKECLKKSALYARKSHNAEKEMGSNFRLTGFNILSGEFETAFDYCQRNMKLSEEIAGKNAAVGRTWAAGQSYTLMSELYETAGDYETALNYIRLARNYYPLDSFTYSVWSAQIGDVFRLMGNTDSALYYLKHFSSNIPEGIIHGLLTNGAINLCNFYNSLNQFDKSLPLINTIMSKATSKTPGWGDGLLVSATTYFGVKNYQKALIQTLAALTQFQKFSRKARIMESYQLLSKIYHDLGKNDSAYYYLNQYTILKDFLLKNQFYFRLNSYKKQAEEERKTGQINLLNKENQLKEQKLKQQATLRNSLIIGILLLLLLGVFVFRNLLLKRKNDNLRMQKDFELQQLESEKKQAELHQKAVELEMQALRAQMNPHFIFNCLSSINRFIFKNDNKTASDYLTRFSRLIRMVLMHSQKKLIPLEDELEMIRLYLDLERLRFKDAFDYSITTTNIVDAGNIFIPPLLLQPFCENAVWHGLMHKGSQGHLNITISEVISEQEKVLHCVIEDDGIGRQKAAEMKSKSAENEKSMGLKITTERLALLNKENNFSTFYKIEDVVNGNDKVTGTRVQLKIKYKETVEEYA